MIEIKKINFKKNINKKTFFIFLAIILILIAFIKMYINSKYIISQAVGNSMNPTIKNGDIVLLEKYNNQELERYQMISFEAEDKNVFKRIIGLPGDTVTFKDGIIFINGECILEEEAKYLSSSPKEDGYNEVFIVPEDCYFVLGDNRFVSRDSRAYANPYISKDSILGIYIRHLN